MGSWVSKDGKWHPAVEKVALSNESGKVVEFEGKTLQPGEPVLYEGTDRGAMETLEEIGETTLGEDFRKSMAFLAYIRQLGYTDLEKYLSDVGYDKEKVEAEFKKKASVINMHELPKRREEIKKLGGGQDTTGRSKPIYGDFGEAPSF